MRDEERELATDAHNEVGMTMRKIRAARWNGSRRVEFNVPATRSVARHNDHLEILIELDVVLPLSALRVIDLEVTATSVSFSILPPVQPRTSIAALIFANPRRNAPPSNWRPRAIELRAVVSQFDL
jgi:hypothetical protein